MAIGDVLRVEREGDSLVTLDGRRRFAPYGDAEWAWWTETDPLGSEALGLWEFQEEDGLAVLSAGFG